MMPSFFLLSDCGNGKIMRKGRHRMLWKKMPDHAENSLTGGTNIMDMEERKAKGLLWTDTEEAMEAQKKARGLCYDFNHIHPSESDRRNEMLPEIFGEVGEGVWIEPPLTCAFGKTVKIGKGTYINSNLTLVDDYKMDGITEACKSPDTFLHLRPFRKRKASWSVCVRACLPYGLNTLKISK